LAKHKRTSARRLLLAFHSLIVMAGLVPAIHDFLPFSSQSPATAHDPPVMPEDDVACGER
jgi:hypothetical protein